MRERPAAAAAAIALVGLAIPNIVFVVTHASLHEANSDVRLYYSAARIGETYGWNAIYDTHLQQQTVAVTTPNSFYVPYVNPPWLAWAMVAVAWLPYPALYGLTLFAGFAALVGASLLVPARSWLERTALLASAIALQPAIIAAYYGNAVVFFPLVLVIVYRLLRADRQVLAGIVLAATSVKPHLVVLVPLALLVSGRYRAFIAWLAAVAVVAGFAVLSLGTNGVHQYLTLLGQTAQLPNQQVATLFHTLGGGVLAWAVTALVLAATGVVVLQRRHALELVLAASLLASMLLNHYLNGLDWVTPVVAVWLLATVRFAFRPLVLVMLWFGLDAVVSFPELAPIASAFALLTVSVVSTASRLVEPRHHQTGNAAV